MIYETSTVENKENKENSHFLNLPTAAAKKLRPSFCYCRLPAQFAFCYCKPTIDENFTLTYPFIDKSILSPYKAV